MLALVVVGRNHHVVTIFVPEIRIGLFHTHHRMSLELNRLRRAQHGLGNHPLHPVIIVEHQV